jgi:transcriptional regulator with XRE-family HTH domain
MSPSALSRIFSGSRDPRLVTLKAISRFLGITIDQVVAIIDERVKARAKKLKAS